jgi:hypothetical protein
MKGLAALVAFLGLAVPGCGPSSPDFVDAHPRADVFSPADAYHDYDAFLFPDGGPLCDVPPVPAGPEATIAAPYDDFYTIYDLGPVPGVPNPLGGATISATDPNVMLIAGSSEYPSGTIYSIGVQRGACNHILGFVGTATPVAATPYVDANLVYTAADLLFFTLWPEYKIGQILPGATATSREIDLVPFGIDNFTDQGPGGIGFVPPGLTGAGELRIVTWPAGHWYHVGLAPDGALYNVTSLTETVQVANNPGGFAYVPAGSPGFDQQAIILAEWNVSDLNLDRVAVYDADAQGDPIPATRREFLSRFPRPWGAYFEPLTGDYFFLSWGTGMDRVYVVQGFVPPPPIGAPPPAAP